MKRTNLVLDEELLKTATRLFGIKTYSATVNRALSDAIKMEQMKNLTNFFGKEIWTENLSKMRQDQPLVSSTRSVASSMGQKTKRKPIHK